MNSTKSRRQSSRQGASGFKFHNFVFNEGKQSFCLEEQDGNKKITVMHWKKTEKSSNNNNGTSSRSEKTFSETRHNFLKKDKNLPPNITVIDVEPEQTQPLDLSTKSANRRREMWSVDEILGLNTPTSSACHLDLPSPSSMISSISCRSPDIRKSSFTSFFPANPFYYGTPPPSPMIDAMLEEEIQRFLRSNSDIFNDQNNNFDSNIEEKLHTLRKELQDRRISSRNETTNDFTRSHFKLKDSITSTTTYGLFDGRDTMSSSNRRTVSELDLKSAKGNKQLKRSYDDNSTSIMFKTKNDIMANKLRQLRKFTRTYLDAHKSAAESVWQVEESPTPTLSSSGALSLLKENSQDMQIECDEQIKKLWPGASNTPTASASSSTVQSSASASSIDGSI